MSELGQLLREKREREGLGLRSAAAASGISAGVLCRIENGSGPSVRVERMARAWLNGETLPLPPLPPSSLRDWFAGQALGAVITEGRPSPGAGTTFDMLAQDAYRFADAMLKQREADNGAR